MIYHQNLFSQLLLLSRLEAIFHLLQIILDLINLAFNLRILDSKVLKKSEQVLRLKNPVAILIKDPKNPKVDELYVAVGGILNERAKLSQSKTLWKAKEMKESL